MRVLDRTCNTTRTFLFFKIMSVSRATDCTLQEIGEYAVSSEDIKRKYKTSLDECKTDCVNSQQCRAMYYINRRCFIIHKEAKRVERMGSSYFQKKCHGLYCKYACVVFNKKHSDCRRSTFR